MTESLAAARVAGPRVHALDPAPDPVAALECFLDLPCPLLLDSAAAPVRFGRYSFLMADPVHVIRSHPQDGRSIDPLDEARALLAPHRAPPHPDLPPFQGGLAGFIGYEFGARLERLPRPAFDDLALPDLLLGLYDWVIAWDHQRGAAWLISTGLPETGPAKARRADARLLEVRTRLEAAGRREAFPRPAPAARAAPAAASPATYPVFGVPDAEAIGLRSTFTPRGYMSAVARVREYILAGDIFQANLSQRFSAPLREAPFDLYRRLRRRNPAPFAAWLDAGDFQILSASPERFLKLDPDGSVETRPIKGTRPRGLGPMHDAMLGRALSESDKDRAENVMIVDLLRNDLSRVCLPRSVRVPQLFTLEQHPTVHHLVSTVTGALEPGRDAIDLLRATFPGGSITGAPKVRAMEIIAELEPATRGVYCGSVGYLSVTGAMDTSIAIRTIVARGDTVYFQAGGGIVADSDPDLEYRETLDKASGLIGALAARPL
ncbi:MAG: aminodeoxychorismate synthase component I [Gemmatimonadota bacterium]